MADTRVRRNAGSTTYYYVESTPYSLLPTPYALTTTAVCVWFGPVRHAYLLQEYA